MSKIIKKLPAVFQTVPSKKFFDSTVDQVFSKKDSEYLAGYVGRRVPGNHNPITDFYLPAPSKNRTWWQLEPTAFSRNADTTKSDVLFYDDLLKIINYYGGNTLNHDRLFSSEYYSFAPPIDYDMFVNYNNYYWVDQRLPTISIIGVLSSDILGKSTFTTPSNATPPNFTLSTGMSVSLVDDPAFSSPHTVENAGEGYGINLVPHFTDITVGSTFEFLPWDGLFNLSSGRIIDNSKWDTTTWDTQYQPATGDYITIERGSQNRNSWSRTNKWIHIDTIKQVMSETGLPFPTAATRAIRPIIQFIPDLVLYNSGTQFRETLSYGLTRDEAGSPYLLEQFAGMTSSHISDTYGFILNRGDLVCFFDDATEIGIGLYPWEMFDWDTFGWDETSSMSNINRHIFEVNISDSGVVTFSPHTDWDTPVVDGDIALIKENGPGLSPGTGETWYFENGTWQRAYNDKVGLNQPPLFQLYDYEGVRLDDNSKYQMSTFRGNKLFSYKVNTAPGAALDPVLGFPILYNNGGLATDIIFQNSLITDSYLYGTDQVSINGYYYYKESSRPVLYNSWDLYSPHDGTDSTATPVFLPSKQRVVDRYVAGYGTKYQFRLSVTPHGYPTTPDIIVSVNGLRVKSNAEQFNGYTIHEINNRLFVDLTDYIVSLEIIDRGTPPVVELRTYTHGLLADDEPGYFEIPQQLEANPSQVEVTELSGSDLTQHFSSIIGNQTGIIGRAFGGPNNYRDSKKNRSVGSYILQNTAPLLKAMLIAPQGDLSFIESARFSSSEYTKFKSKYLSVAHRLINQAFNINEYNSGTINVGSWVEEILKTVNISKEFSDAFAYSQMIANGPPLAIETHTVPVSPNTIQISTELDLSDIRNALYVYNASNEDLLLVDKDYRLTLSGNSIEIEILSDSNIVPGDEVRVALYSRVLPAYIPSTPSKLGMYPVHIPRIEWDTTYSVPTWVIIGHDGSKTVAYGDYRDQLLLELEKRVYNLIPEKFRKEYSVPVRHESVRPGFFRNSRYSVAEYNNITESYLNKWSAKNGANYRVNEWSDASSLLPVNSSNLWKLYNYRSAVDTSGNSLNLPGHWKGIFLYMYDTYCPDTNPWEMLGFTSEPVWWRYEYGAPSINSVGKEVWTSTAAGAHNMYSDIENGIIRQGATAIYDPVTLIAQTQPMWARPGITNFIPVDVAGELRPILDINNFSNSLFPILNSGNQYSPFDGYDHEWVYGDGAPVEQAWISSAEYPFSVQEFLFLMRPSTYGEYMWDPLSTGFAPSVISVPTSGPLSSTDVSTNNNWQFVSTSASSENVWKRPNTYSQYVHGENIDGSVEIRHGYQRWISDRILFLGKNPSEVFGQKVRTLDVNLANKLAGFTNKDTTNLFIESITPGSLTQSLGIPSTNFDVILYKSPAIETYSYSGIIVRALEDGTFSVYGYDLLSSAFTVLDRSTDKLIDVSIGGAVADFQYFSSNTQYNEGDIVRYNGVYYMSLASQTLQSFSTGAWQKLKSLPVVGGVSVSYKPISKPTTTRVPYGSILPDAQAVFDLIIGWGAYLESRGWQFTDVNPDTNQLSDWLYSAKQFLFWLNTSWAPDAVIQLSPSANNATLIAPHGYPGDVETISNGVYSILDKSGISIPPIDTITDREGKLISVKPRDLTTGGIFYLHVNVSETEHVLIIDNKTSFGDVVYEPLLRTRQNRIRFNGFKTNNWYGKMEAPGYLIINNQIVPNFDTIVDSMRYYYDPDTTIDNASLEDLGRRLIGYENKQYLDNLQVSDDVQYLFHQGAMRQKGTAQALDKLFRSNKVQSTETIEVYEEWAVKLGEFGNLLSNVDTEFTLIPESKSIGDSVVARLNYVPSSIGHVKYVRILNAENVYSVPPVVEIGEPDSIDIDPSQLRRARAYAILGTNGAIIRIDVADRGYGYTFPPAVSIISPDNVGGADKAYSVWQGDILHDTVIDGVVDIDIDDSSIWTSRPTDPAHTLRFPTTSDINTHVLNAGYVNFNDVDFSSFDIESTAVNWGTLRFNPKEGNSLWVSKTFTDDWDVYKLVLIASNSTLTPSPNSFSVVEDENKFLLLKTTTNLLIQPHQSSTTLPAQVNTDFGNLLVLQAAETTAAVVSVSPSTSSLNYTVGFEFDRKEGDYNYYKLLKLDGTQISSDEITQYADFTKLLIYKTLRFWSLPTTLLPYIAPGDKIWVDGADLEHPKWSVYNVNAGNSLTLYRREEPLVDVSLFESATIFSKSNSQMLIKIPAYDPYKGVLPATVSQNITYMRPRDPAKYNVTTDPQMFSQQIVFGENQVGELWWDISSCRYLHYEQPRWLNSDGTYGENATDNLIYRRDNWGNLFPGSKIDIYEWTKSPVPPADYTDGIVKSTDSYVEITSTNRFTNITETYYYFWVLNPSTRPAGLPRRTRTAADISRLLISPKSQNFAFFAPIHNTDVNNSYIFHNVQDMLLGQPCSVQIIYKLSNNSGGKHTQWAFIREDDKTSIISDQLWDKLVDSLCGYTKVLPLSSEYSNSILIDGGEVLPVPDPALSDYEMYGIGYRPRQGMFVNIRKAREVFVQAANSLLQYIAIRDDDPSWNETVLTNNFWEYTTWYKKGYENIEPNKAYRTLVDASNALSSDQLRVGDVVKIIEGTDDGRFTLYAVNQSGNSSILEGVAIEDSAIRLLGVIPDITHNYGMSVELRQLLNVFKTRVFINENIINQNRLFFSMINYVFSEQNNPSWAFKSSYIYIKENNVPLNKLGLYLPNQIENVISHINDVKPYHTKIRDYSSNYVANEVAIGNAVDSVRNKLSIVFGNSYNTTDGIDSADGLVMNIDTALTLSNSSDGYVSVNWSLWDTVTPDAINQIIEDLNGSPADIGWDSFQWDQVSDDHVTVNHHISSRHVVNDTTTEFLRNSISLSGELQEDISGISDSLIVSSATDIFPEPSTGMNAVWVDGERIVYNTKASVGAGLWQLSDLTRGTSNTSADSHIAVLPSALHNRVWVEFANQLPPGSAGAMWTTPAPTANISTEIAPGEFSNVSFVNPGGLWYAETVPAAFLRNGQGKANN